MAERDAMEALEAADQRRKLTDPEHVELLALKLMSQVGDDVQKVYDHEALFKNAAATLRALSAKLQEPVEVKPLEWARTHFGWEASGYEVYGDDKSASVRVNDRLLFSTGGKAAAQAHHDARVRAMLIDRGE